MVGIPLLIADPMCRKSSLVARTRLSCPPTETYLASSHMADTPFSQGAYVVDGEPVEWSFPNFPVMPYGRYRFVFTMGKQKSQAKLICLMCDCQVVPKTT